MTVPVCLISFLYTCGTERDGEVTLLGGRMARLWMREGGGAPGAWGEGHLRKPVLPRALGELRAMDRVAGRASDCVRRASEASHNMQLSDPMHPSAAVTAQCRKLKEEGLRRRRGRREGKRGM